jgi:hypothetical protein
LNIDSPNKAGHSGKMWFWVRLLLAAVALVALGSQGVKAVRLRGRLLEARSKLPSPEMPGGVGFLSTTGVDIWGNIYVPKTVDLQHDTVVFVLRSSSYAKDIAVWNLVSRRAEATGNPDFLAICSDQTCVASARQSSVGLFPVLAFGQVTALERMVSADKLGDALIVNHLGKIKGAVRWRGEPAAATATRLLNDQ